MSDLRDLYQEVIIDHSRKPRNFHEMPAATWKAEGYNPLCGDRVTVYVQMQGDRVSDVSFQGVGCAISTASASIMTEALKGRTIDEVDALFTQFHHLVTGQGDVPEADQLGKMAVFSGVREYPVRVKCATLAWHTLKAALEHRNEAVSTE